MLPHLCLVFIALSALAVDGYDVTAEQLASVFPRGVPIVSAAAGDPCLQIQLDYCQKQFATDLDTDPAIFKTPSLLFALLNQVYQKDIDKGFISMCNARNEFQKCLGIFYPSCTDYLTILGTQGLSSPDSFILWAIYSNLNFDCSSGLTQAIDNWACLKLVHNSDAWKQKSKTCFDTYNATTNQDSSSFCTASQTYATCLSDIYKDPSVSDCDYREPQWWECERALRRSKLDGYCDTTTCSKIFEGASLKQFESMSDMLRNDGIFNPIQLKMFKLLNKYGRH